MIFREQKPEIRKRTADMIPPAVMSCVILISDSFSKIFIAISAVKDDIFAIKIQTTNVTPIIPKRKSRDFSAPYFNCSGSISARNKMTRYKKMNVVRKQSAVLSVGTRSFS